MPKNETLKTWLPYGATTFILFPLSIISDFAVKMDAFMLVTFTLWKAYPLLLALSLPFDYSTLLETLKYALAALLSVYLATSWRKSATSQPTVQDDSPRPLFIPSLTSHTRMFPKIHTFSYNYLMVGTPVGWRGSAGMLSIDENPGQPPRGFFRTNWFCVRAEDYLERGYGHLGLDGKLRKYLLAHGHKLEDYPYAYLITGAKCFNYVFNPVSFWYLYNSDRELAAVILEVNNTFEERRIYFVKPDAIDNLPSDLQAQLDANTAENKIDVANLASIRPKQQKLSARYRQTVQKDLHVSPFSSRKGGYSFVGYDPIFPSMSGCGPLNHTICLTSSKNHAKLVARILSRGPLFDPATMTPWQNLVFLLSWYWVGFLTFPRSIRQAMTLYFERKLHIWIRPEPLKESIPRFATPTEAALEKNFRLYLQHLVESCSAPMIVHYKGAGLKDRDPEATFYSPSAYNSDDPAFTTSEDKTETLSMTVLTPLFYGRFVHYPRDLEGFFGESVSGQTLYVSRPELLPSLVLSDAPPKQTAADSWVNFILFAIIRVIRCLPAPIEGPPKSRSELAQQEVSEFQKSEVDTRTKVVLGTNTSNAADIGPFNLSPMDAFVSSSLSTEDQLVYAWEVTKVLVSEYVAFGDVGLLGAQILFMRGAAAWFMAGLIVKTWALLA